MKKDGIVKILFVLALLISVYFIVSGLLGNSIVDSTIYEEGISIDTTTVDLTVNESKTINASVIPPNATYQSLTWTSINPTIATVNNGVVTGISPGTCMIKVETEKMKITKVITVNVKPIVINVEQIIVDNSNIEIYEGETAKVNYKVLPENATNKNLNFKSDNPSVAAFNDQYEIVGVSEGETVITLSSNNGITAKVTVKVKKKIIDVSKIELNKKGLILKVGNSETLTAKVTTSNATDKTITWKSSNTKVATVENGLVKAIGYGDTVITAKTNSGMEETCTIVVPKEHELMNKAVSSLLSDSSRNIKTIFKNNNCKKEQHCDRPNIYNSKISGNIKVSLYNVSSNKKEYISTVSDSIMLTNILIPGNTYYLESSTNSKNYEYVSINKGVRMIQVKSVRNIRDFGGWKADGGTLKYGLIFRGASPYESLSDTEATFKRVGITDIVDIRSNAQFRSDRNKLPSFTKHNFQVYGYTVKRINSRNAVEAIMKLVVAGKKVYFHCAVGTDRTGTIAMLLEGILGLSKTNLFDDYELSYFRREVWNSGKTRNGSEINSLYNQIKASGTMEQEKFINWFLSESKDKNKDLNLINNFRKKMINGNPTVYKLSGGNLVKE
jgi:uncharacterized protein YjdB/protein tyrosine/serine phosphatase